MNHVETNFVDNPDSKRVVIREDRSHSIMDHSKSSYSVMLPVAADGFVLQPYTYTVFTSMTHRLLEGQREPDRTVSNLVGGSTLLKVIDLYLIKLV